MKKIGVLKTLRRYPVKSMMGEDLSQVFVSYSGVMGDRVYAFVDENNTSKFPWMTARQKHEMILFKPQFKNLDEKQGWSPHPELYELTVTTPENKTFQIDDNKFKKYLEKRFGRPLYLRTSEKGMHDSRPLSIFSYQTVKQLEKETGKKLDHKRFRANFYVEWNNKKPFYEDELVGKELQIGETVQIQISKKDPRCVIITLDPDSSKSDINILTHIAKHHGGCAGVYAVILREGHVKAGDSIVLL